jgi:hypothetical protein
LVWSIFEKAVKTPADLCDIVDIERALLAEQLRQKRRVIFPDIPSLRFFFEIVATDYGFEPKAIPILKQAANAAEAFDGLRALANCIDIWRTQHAAAADAGDFDGVQALTNQMDIYRAQHAAAANYDGAGPAADPGGRKGEQDTLGIPPSVYRLLDFIDTENPKNKEIPKERRNALGIACKKGLIEREALESEKSDWRTTVTGKIECDAQSVRFLDVYGSDLHLFLTEQGKDLLAEWRERQADTERASDKQGEQGGATESPAPVEEYYFVQWGNGFDIAGFGESGHLSGLKGLSDIAKLLRTPGKGVSMFDLDGIDRPSFQSEQSAMDRQAMNAAKDELRELRSDLERAKRDNDTGAAERCQKEIDNLIELLGNSSYRGKAKDLNSRLNKLRPKIHNRLQSVYKAMRKADPPMSKLAGHLEVSITAQGSDFIYSSAGVSIPWRFERPPKK